MFKTGEKVKTQSTIVEIQILQIWFKKSTTHINKTSTEIKHIQYSLTNNCLMYQIESHLMLKAYTREEHQSCKNVPVISNFLQDVITYNNPTCTVYNLHTCLSRTMGRFPSAGRGGRAGSEPYRRPKYLSVLPPTHLIKTPPLSPESPISASYDEEISFAPSLGLYHRN